MELDAPCRKEVRSQHAVVGTRVRRIHSRRKDAIVARYFMVPAERKEIVAVTVDECKLYTVTLDRLT
jgi:hypothetical protein